MKKLWIFLSLIFWRAWAAPCCGGGGGSTNLITGDSRLQVNGSYAIGKVIGDALVNDIPLFRSSSDKELTHTWILSGNMIIEDPWQFGVSVPVIIRSRRTKTEKASSFGLGDMNLTVGYEFLPEYTYHPWRPRGYLYAQWTFPTGGSVYEAKLPFSIDARGRGFQTAAVGVQFLKVRGVWDYALQGQLNKAFSRTFAQDSSLYKVNPGLGGSLFLGLGWTSSDKVWRFGVFANPVIEGGKTIEGDSIEKSSYQQVWNTGFSLWRYLSEDWGATISYTDQTFLGPAKNVTLSRTLSFSISYALSR